MNFPTLEATIGNTPLVRLQRLPVAGSNTVLVKLEGNNPAGSVKDRPALSMIRHAERRGEIKPGDTLIEATSGNTGIALAMVAAMKGYRMVLIMPEHMSVERRAVMKAFGAEIILVTKEQSMEGARDLADEMGAFPIRTIHWRIMKAPARRSGVIPMVGLHTSLAPWARPAPSWAHQHFSRKRTRLSRSSA